jgi:hypothetical protein
MQRTPKVAQAIKLKPTFSNSRGNNTSEGQEMKVQ